MSETGAPSLSRRLQNGVAWTFAKFQSIPPLITLPVIGLVAWLITPYAIKLAEGRSAAVTDPAVAVTGEKLPATQTEPVTPGPATSSFKTAGVASVLTMPVTASAIPSWLPLPAPAPALAPAPPAAPQQPRSAQRPIYPAPQPQQARTRTVGSMPQQRSAERQFARSGPDERRSAGDSLMQSFRNAQQTGRGAAVGNSGLNGKRSASASLMQSFRNAVQTGRSAAVGHSWMSHGSGNGGQQWPHMGGYVARGSFGGQMGFRGGYRSFGMGGFGGMRGGGGFSGFRGGGGRR